MEYEETTNFTPRGSAKLKLPGAKAAANLKRRISNRLSRTISSERAPGSDASNENVETPRTKRFSLKHRRSKSRVKQEEKTMAPRRSFSVDDMSKLVPDDVDREPITPLETEVKVTSMDDTDNLIQEIIPDSEGAVPVPPETPVPEQRPVENRDTRLSSNFSVEAPEIKGLASEDQTVPVETAEWTEQVESVEREVDLVGEIEPDNTFDLSPDADATIDDAIQETVMASLGAREPTEEVKVETEPKTLHDVHMAVTQSMEGKEAVEKPTEKVEEPKEIPTESRDVIVDESIDRETEQAVREVEQPKSTSKEVKDKSKRRRFRRLLKPASFSLATLAVGLLLIILKKH